MTPHEVIKDSLEKTEHIIPKIVFEGENVAVDLLKDTSISLLLSVKEMVEQRNNQYECTVEDVINLLDEEINKVKEL